MAGSPTDTVTAHSKVTGRASGTAQSRVNEQSTSDCTQQGHRWVHTARSRATQQGPHTARSPTGRNDRTKRGHRQGSSDRTEQGHKQNTSDCTQQGHHRDIVTAHTKVRGRAAVTTPSKCRKQNTSDCTQQGHRCGTVTGHSKVTGKAAVTAHRRSRTGQSDRSNSNRTEQGSEQNTSDRTQHGHRWDTVTAHSKVAGIAHSTAHSKATQQ